MWNIEKMTENGWVRVGHRDQEVFAKHDAYRARAQEMLTFKQNAAHYRVWAEHAVTREKVIVFDSHVDSVTTDCMA